MRIEKPVYSQKELEAKTDCVIYIELSGRVWFT